MSEHQYTLITATSASVYTDEEPSPLPMHIEPWDINGSIDLPQWMADLEGKPCEDGAITEPELQQQAQRICDAKRITLIFWWRTDGRKAGWAFLPRDEAA